MKSFQKVLSELIQKQQLLDRNHFESQNNCSSKDANIKQLENTLIETEGNKKLIENNQNYKTNETEIYNSTRKDHNYEMKQNAKANTLCQTVTKTKALNHENP